MLGYLVNTSEIGLVLGGLRGVRLYAIVDASCGTHEDRKPHSGCTLHIGEGSRAFMSRSKKQRVTADTSTVAEFIATHLVAKERMWARSLLEVMEYTQSDPAVLGEDNLSTITMIKMIVMDKSRNELPFALTCSVNMYRIYKFSFRIS